MQRRIFITLVLVLALALPLAAHARLAAPEPPPPQHDAVELDFFLTVQFPTLEGAPRFTAQALRAPLVYWRERGHALIKGEDIPELVYSAAKGTTGDEGALTVTVEGVPGTVAVLDWQLYPTITLSPLELRVRAYHKTIAELAEGDQPFVDIILSNLTLTTEEVSAGNLSTAGYLDAEKLEAQLAFTTILPDDDYPAYQKWLAGKPILGELRVVLPNPFSQQP